ncbi:uncharacterized protein LOC125063180 isoform X2 [Pieris napi]|uniref:uncharacterized protein LOC125063180 isoform X2 n=1 Tax=Pieris napi TaxID=78633 RepID=UPI001FB89231|nr:uncharacterized protein LOC125063180 isoform X2 [Pieris napi]
MVEFDIVDKDEAENVEKNPPTDMGMVNLALKECGFGKFHLRLLFSSFVAHTAGVIATATTPYILPIAECDLDMNLVEKGVLNAIPYLDLQCHSVHF